MSQTENTRAFVEQLFDVVAKEGLGQTFLNHLSPDVKWNATGTSPLSGQFNSKQQYQDEILARLKGRLEHAPKPRIDRILADGDWATILFRTEGARAVSGLDFSMEYCWVIRVQERKIVEVVGFFDQKKVADLFKGD